MTPISINLSAMQQHAEAVLPNRKPITTSEARAVLETYPHACQYLDILDAAIMNLTLPDTDRLILQAIAKDLRGICLYHGELIEGLIYDLHEADNPGVDLEHPVLGVPVPAEPLRGVELQALEDAFDKSGINHPQFPFMQ